MIVVDALGNPIQAGAKYEDSQDTYDVLEVTPSGLVIYNWFGYNVAVDEEVATWYPEGEYPREDEDLRTWWQVMEDDFMQKPRDEFYIWFDGGNWTFKHLWRNIDPHDLLPDEEKFSTQKEITDDDYGDLSDKIEAYLKELR